MKSDNELIADFMGGKTKQTALPTIADRMQPDDIWLPIHGIIIIKELSYQKSWDWLMPVVDKIESMNFYINGEEFSFDVIIRYDTCTVEDEDSTRKNLNIFQYSENNRKIEAVYKSVVEFIKWYNQYKNENR